MFRAVQACSETFRNAQECFPRQSGLYEGGLSRGRVVACMGAFAPQLRSLILCFLVVLSCGVVASGDGHGHPGPVLRQSWRCSGEW